MHKAPSTDARQKRRDLNWLAVGAVGFLAGLGLVILLRAVPMGAQTHAAALKQLALVLMIAAPVTAFYRVLKPKLAGHCPRPPEPE
jgi:hypothetical protein